MPSYQAPGVYIEEVDRGAKPIEGVGTSTAGFLGVTERGPVAPKRVSSFPEFERLYGGFKLYKPGAPLAGTYLAYAVDGFFANGGTECYIGRVVPAGTDTAEATLASAAAGATTASPTLSTARLDFGTVVVGETATETITLTNPPASAGGTEIPLDDSTLSDVADAFSVTDDRGTATTLSPGGTLTVTVEAARTPGPRRRSDTLTVSLGAFPAVGVELVADLPDESDPEHTLGTAALFVDVGTVQFGSDPTDVSVPLENLTDAAIPSADVSVTLDAGSDFSVAFDAEIPADGQETATVTFTPPTSETSVIEDTLRVTHDGVEQFTVRVSATLQSNFSVDSASLDVERGTPETVTITNTDSDPVPQDEIEVTLVGTDASAFTVGDVGSDIAPGGSFDVEVTLTATDSRPKHAELHVRRLQTVGTDEVRLPPVVVELTGNPGGTPSDAAQVTALGPGQWGSRIALFVSEGSLSTDDRPRVTVTLRYWAEEQAVSLAAANGANPEKEGVPAPDVEEVYENLSAEPTSSDYYVTVLNGASNLVRVDEQSTATPAVTVGPTWLSGSFDAATAPTLAVSDFVGSASAGGRTGLRAFETVDEIAVVCIPDERNERIPGNSDPGTGLTGKLVEHCTSMQDRFAVLQSPLSPDLSAEPPLDSTYAAFYYPWVRVMNPETNRPEFVPPGGHICGIYARSDTERGVHKAPANEPVRNVSELQVQVTQSDQKSLNPRGINCLRSFPGRGIRVWGARTTSTDPSWKYVNVRRLFLYLEESIDEATQWVVFEPNNEMLWARVRQSVSNFLTTVWRTGALMGTAPDEAFFVKCDRTTMSQDDIDNGRLIIEIGVAPTKPAEFVIFRISQVASGGEGA